VRVKLSHRVQGRCWVGQDVDTHKPVYVYLRNHDSKEVLEGREIEYYLTELGEHWEVHEEG
jgi:hypothetical protein